VAEALTYRVLHTLRKPEKFMLALPVPTEFNGTSKLLLMLRNELLALQRRQAEQAATTEASIATSGDSQRIMAAARIARGEEEARRILVIAASGGSVEERLGQMLADELLRLDATAADLGAVLGCSKAAIGKTTTWAILKRKREQEKQRRREAFRTNGKYCDSVFRRR
jgi:hypothetical protein